MSELSCWAVGYYFASGRAQTLIEHWDGTSWAVVDSPNTSSTHDNILSSVTCSSSECWAVGYSFNGGGAWRTLIVHWDGNSWAIVDSPNTSTTESNRLTDVTCNSDSECWAVGYYKPSTLWQTMIVRWNGTSWVIVSSPNADTTQNNVLAGLTCVSSSDCWAVGSYYTIGIPAKNQTLIEHWNGTSWAIVESPDTPIALNTLNFLSSVSCVSSSDCWAVGYYKPLNRWQTLIEHWDGDSWAIVISPNSLITEDNRLSSVSCVSSSDCWAVGDYFKSGIGLDGGVGQTLIEHWDGTSWTVVKTPSSSTTQSNRLVGVSCVSASECWAAGYHRNEGGVDQALIEHWDGTSWTIVNSPNALVAQHNRLSG
ncbi:MAG: hypothetical protein ACRDQ2_14795 [Gaiellales bacterium]